MQQAASPSVFTDITPPVPGTRVEDQNVRVTPEPTEAPPDATPPERDLSPGRKALGKIPRKGEPVTAELSSMHAPPTSDPRAHPNQSPRGENREVVLAVVRHRLLSLDQLRRSVFPNRTLQAVGQRVGRLRADGWLRTWDQPVASGGRPRFVLPSARAQRWAYHELLATARGTPAEALVRTMLPARPPPPLTLATGGTPPFFQHQKETNDLAIAVAMYAGGRLRWCSTWERPFPVQAGGITLPQPDAVFLFDLPTGPRLVLLEHDRGMEPVRHFQETKPARYADLLAQPELCLQLFGTRDLEIWVSVIDARERRPLRRLEALRRTTAVEHLTAHVRFTLAGWLRAFAGGSVFFPRGVGPTTEEVAASAHRLEPLVDPTTPPARAS